jgi:hypothetical protein
MILCLEKNPSQKKGLKKWFKWKSNCIAGVGPQFEPHAVPQNKTKQKINQPLLMINKTVVISMLLTTLTLIICCD